MEFLKANARAIIIALLAVGIVVAISASSDSQETNTANEPESSESTDAEATEKEKQENVDATQSDEANNEEATSQEDEQQVEKTGDEFSVSAVEGDNQTKLVRRIVALYADEKSVELSAEQKLAVETKLVNELDKDNLIYVGDTVRLSEATIQAQVESAQNLSEAQLALWAQYL